MPKFMPVFSRFNTALTFGQMVTVLGEWRDTIILDFPLLIVSSISYNNYAILKRADFILGALIIATLLIILKKKNATIAMVKKNQTIILLLFLIVLLASSSLYVFTGMYPNVGSYDNRGLSSTWIALSLLLAFLGCTFIRTKAFYIFIPITTLCLSSFLISRDNYISSYQTQNKIASDIERLVKTNEAIKKINAPIIIIANVPHYTMPNYNNVEIFSNPWDIGLMLPLKTGNLVGNANTLTADRISAKQVSISEDSINIGGWEEKISKLWYYEFDQHNGISALLKVKSKDQLEEIIKRVNYTELNTCPPNYFNNFKESVFKRL